MAAEMMEKILAAEKDASQKLRLAEEDAKVIVSQAEKDAEKLKKEAKIAADKEASAIADNCTAYTSDLVNNKREEAEKAALALAEKAKSKNAECIKTVVEMIVG